jgi:polysaccharide deacetylase 2 family uncharacterized protein YibQ
MAVGSMSEDDVLPGAQSGRRLPHPLAIAWFLLFAVLVAAAGYVAVLGKASDGGPSVSVAVAEIAPVRRKPPPARPAAVPNRAAEVAPTAPAPAETQAPAAVAGQAAAVPPQIVPATITKPVYAGKALLADPALIEQTSEGPLPRIADDGRTPMQAYAPPPPPLKGRKPIAIVVTGLGISAKATETALQGLPPGVTLAFAPYAGDVQRWVGEARRLGHEVLLEVPMEPYDFPDSDPGPHTLRPMLSEDGNMERLKWSLTRFTGYAGITNLLGGRFLANSDATAPMMTELARRGLFFYDGGTTTRSEAAGIASQIKAPYVESTITLDSIQSGMEIDQKLSELEARARVTGSASGTGFLYPVTIQRIAAWCRGLEGRGFVLVPASAIVAEQH